MQPEWVCILEETFKKAHWRQISVPSDKRDLQNKTAEQNCLQHLRVSATTRFPLFQAFTFNPADGKAAQWIRSEILMFFVFFLLP